ncbi:probable endoglucanase I precursor [Cephalotrichum gorgonifer]|uniref:Probable endoglucanase I n=1 Tax=Cephalotrichum gorgonifer TaxID=2041049 RepID=A0AAE8N410_9PEZI|nr:probable endoglucanase I precursor [Cephalotrichum gorgonifer]
MKSQLFSLLSLTSLALAQNLCDQYSYYAQDGFYFNNNEWGAGSGSGSQCTYVDSVSSGGVSWHTEWTWSGGENQVKSYPYSGRELTTKKLVSNIASIPTTAEWKYEGNNLRCNIAYDLFTAADPNHDISSGEYELMIWLGNLGPVYPIGGNPIATVNINGQNWNLHSGLNGAMRVFSFVAPSQITSFSTDIKPFFNYLAQNQGFPASSQYLLNLQFGSEPFTGSNARFTVSNWSGSVN